MTTEPLIPSKAEFIYVAGRGFYRIVPRHPSLPEAMTQQKGRLIAERKGMDFDLVFDTTSRSFESDLPNYERYATANAVLSDSTWQAFENVGEGASPLLEPVDGFFLFEFATTKMQFLKLLCDRRDPHHGHKSAFDRYLFHWGLQNWGGLAIEIRIGDCRLFRTEVDVFAPQDTEELSGVVYLGVISVDPERYERRKTAEEEPVNGSTTDHPPDARDLSSDASKHKADEAPSKQSNHRVSEGEKSFVGKCRKCGGTLTLDVDFVALLRNQGGYALVPCDKCGQTANVRLLSQDEMMRKGYIAEVIS